VMAQIGTAWNVSRADMRAVRAAVIHAGVESDWQAKPSELMAAVAERIPALRALRGERRPSSRRRAYAALKRSEPTARDLLKVVSTNAAPGEALRWHVATGTDRDEAAALLGRDPRTF